MGHNIRNQPSTFEETMKLDKVLWSRANIGCPKENDEMILEFIKNWTDDKGLDEVVKQAKSYTEPRGIHVNYLQEMLQDFINDTSLRLFKLKRNYKNFEKGQIFEAKGEETRTHIDVQTLKGNELIKIKRKFLEEIDRRKWTVEDIVFYKFSRDYKEIFEASMYKKIRLEGTGTIGPLFEGVYVIASRKNIYCDLLSAAIEKAKADGQCFVYFDFFAVNYAHRDAYLSRKDHGKGVREYFIRNICPKLVASFDKVYLYIDDWRNPSVFTRGWCMYELFWAFDYNIPVDLIYHKNVLNGFEASITVEFKNDYFSYHDTASTFFTGFKHFSYSMLRNGSEDDNSLIKNTFNELDLNRPEDRRVKAVLSTSLLELLAGIVIHIGNERLDDLVQAIHDKDFVRLDQIVIILRKCAFYLRRANYNTKAIGFYTRCRKALERLPRSTIKEVHHRSKSIMRIKFDITKCYIRESFVYFRADEEKNRRTMLEYAASTHNEADLHANLAVASYIVISFFKDFKQRRNKVTFDNKERDIISNLQADMQARIVTHANRPVEKQIRMPKFTEKNMKPLLDSFAQLTENIKQKMVNYAISTNRRNEKVILLHVDRFYSKYLKALAIAGIDMQGKVIEITQVPENVIKTYNDSFAKFVQFRKRQNVILEQEIFLRLDHINVLKRSKNNTDGFNLLSNLSQLKELLQKSIASFIEKISDASNEEKIKLKAERSHLHVTYSFVLFELAKFSYKNKVGSLDQCLEHMKDAESYLSNVTTDRARTLARDIDVQRKKLKGILVSADIDRHVLSDGSFITLEQEFSFSQGQD